MNPIIEDIQGLLLSKGDDWQQRAVYAEKLLATLGKIFTSKASGVTLVYFMECKAATAWSIQCDTGMPEGTVYRTLERLRAMGVIERCQKVRMKKGGGPRPTVYALVGASSDSIALAINKHRNLSNPMFRVAQGIVQQLLTDGVKEITLSQLRERCPAKRFRPFELAEAAVPLLHAEGVKVWR